MITDPVRCNSSADTARHSGTSALIAFALLNDSAGSERDRSCLDRAGPSLRVRAAFSAR
jgi:hypothetical protein